MHKHMFELHVSIIRGSFIHLLTSLTTRAFLRGVNVMDNYGPEKSLRANLDIWQNSRGIYAPYHKFSLLFISLS